MPWNNEVALSYAKQITVAATGAAIALIALLPGVTFETRSSKREVLAMNAKDQCAPITPAWLSAYTWGREKDPANYYHRVAEVEGGPYVDCDDPRLPEGNRAFLVIKDASRSFFDISACRGCATM
jgi:hypothetical protein